MSTFYAETIALNPSVSKLTFHAGDKTGPLLTRMEAMALFRDDDDFCRAFSSALANAPMEAFFWETPPFFRQTIDQPFECVLTRSPALARQGQDTWPFAAQISGAGAGDVVVFPNIGGDADLVVPCDTDCKTDYTHLASFLRTAPESQVRELWRRVAETAEAWLAEERTFWVSTSGLGVAWLHVRIDTRPKYYSHAPYREAG